MIYTQIRWLALLVVMSTHRNLYSPMPMNRKTKPYLKSHYILNQVTTDTIANNHDKKEVVKKHTEK